MIKLLAVSPVGANGQTVVPAAIRRMFGIAPGRNLVGFYLDGGRVEIAPVSVVRKRAVAPGGAAAPARGAAPKKAGARR